MYKFLNHDDVERFRRLVESAGRIALTCHVRPDGDAIGATLGLMHMLRALGKEAVVVTPDQPPRALDFLPGFKEISVYTRHEEYCRRILAESDLIICCDFNKPSRQDRLASAVTDSPAKRVLIDHHLDPDDFCEVSFSFPDMSSTCEVAFRLIAALGLYVDMSLDTATCLLTGMVTDTRNFSVNCKNPDLYEILVKLLEKGADKTYIVKKALDTQSLASLRLQAYDISDKMEIFEKHHVAVTTLDKGELKVFGYERGDTEGLVNLPLQVRGMVASFFLREDDDCIKVSARSVSDYPVSKVCESLFGGGGHLMAAGGEYHGSLADCRRILVEALPDYDRYLPQRLEKIE